MNTCDKINDAIARYNDERLTYKLPSFLAIGAMKSGSTTLHAYLSEHPDLHASADRKELHFFDRNFLKGLGWYSSWFEGAGDKMCFESTPSYVFEPDIPYRVQATLPDAKFVVILRDPVSRAFSQFKHMVFRGRETETFRQAIDLEDARTSEAYERIVRRDVVAENVVRWFCYVKRGMYADQLERWFKVFPRDRMLILDFADLTTAPQKAVDQTTDFLGLSRMKIDVPVHRNRIKSSEVMSDEDAAYLRDIYAEHDARLEALLGRKMSWMT